MNGHAESACQWTPLAHEGLALHVLLMSNELDRLAAALADTYTIERELGRGGMATVYLAEDLKHHRQVAIKVFKPDLAAVLGPDRFLREIEIAARLHHPHILPLYDSGEAAGFLFYTMPYVEGESLRDRLDREKQLPIDDALHIAREVADALSYAHSHAVVHRDIKPENIMLEAGHAVVTDFGIARAISAAGGDRLTQTGMAVGTPGYMSPEQVSGDSDELDGRSDLYGLGCVLFEMLAGQPPFTGPTTESIMRQHQTAEPPSVTVLRPAVPADVAGTVARALSKTPADRFSPAALFAEALAQAQTAAVPAVAMPARRNLVWPAIIAVAIVVIAALTVPRVLRRSGPTLIPQPQQVTFDGNVIGATMSPDGQFIAYVVSDPGSGQRLMVRELGQGTSLEIASFGFLCCPQWSPDGSTILFREGTRTEGRSVVLPRLGGGTPREVTAEVVAIWSPDGTQIASWWPQAESIWLTEVATGDTTGSVPLTVPHEWVNGMDWSPTGTRVIVALKDANQWSLWSIAVDGTDPRLVVRDTVRVISPHWSSDNVLYYLQGGDSRAMELVAISVSPDGDPRGSARQLLSGLSVGMRADAIPVLSVSEGRDRILYPRAAVSSNLWLYDTRNPGPDGTVMGRSLTTGTAIRSSPRLSPNDSQLAFVESTIDHTNVFVYDLDAGASRQLTFMDTETWAPAWSPDGSRIAFASAQGGPRRVWTIEANGGTARPFEQSLVRTRVAWAPSSQILYLVADDQDYTVLDPNTGAERSLLSGSEFGWMYNPRPSPDGAQLAVDWNRTDGQPDGLWLVSIEDGAQTLLQEGMQPIGWTTAGDGIYAVRGATAGNLAREIYVVSSSGGEPRLVATLARGFVPRDVAISPDGRLVVAVAVETRTDAWVVEDFDSERR